MILIGRHRSPFVSRVVTVLGHHGMESGHRPFRPEGEDEDAGRRCPPLVRVPVPILDRLRITGVEPRAAAPVPFPNAMPAP